MDWFSSIYGYKGYAGLFIMKCLSGVFLWNCLYIKYEYVSLYKGPVWPCMKYYPRRAFIVMTAAAQAPKTSSGTIHWCKGEAVCKYRSAVLWYILWKCTQLCCVLFSCGYVMGSYGILTIPILSRYCKCYGINWLVPNYDKTQQRVFICWDVLRCIIVDFHWY